MVPWNMNRWFIGLNSDCLQPREDITALVDDAITVSRLPLRPYRRGADTMAIHVLDQSPEESESLQILEHDIRKN